MAVVIVQRQDVHAYTPDTDGLTSVRYGVWHPAHLQACRHLQLTYSHRTTQVTPPDANTLRELFGCLFTSPASTPPPPRPLFALGCPPAHSEAQHPRFLSRGNCGPEQYKGWRGVHRTLQPSNECILNRVLTLVCNKPCESGSAIFSELLKGFALPVEHEMAHPDP